MNLKAHLLAATAGIALVTFSSNVSQANVPTIDSRVAAETARTAANAAEQVNRLTELRSIAENTLSAIGEAGAPESLREMPQWEEFSNGGRIAEILRQFSPNTCAIVACKDAAGGDEAIITDLATARDWVNRSFFSSGRVNSSDTRDFVEVRQRAVREAALNGYALSLASRGYAAKAEERGMKLEDIVMASTSLRSDVQANTAVMLAQYQQTGQTIALLTALVETEAAKNLAGDANYMSSQGGTSAPEVYNDSDYTITGTRKTVSKTAEGEGSGKSNELPWLKNKNGAIEWNPPAGTSPGAKKGVTDALGNGGLPGQGGWSNSNVDPWMDSARSIASASGQGDVARGLGDLSSAVKNGDSDPYGAAWVGAEILARAAGKDDVARIISSARYAANSNDPTSINNLLSLAESAARNTGNYEASSYISSARGQYQNGQINSQDAAARAISVLSNSQGGPNMSSLVSNVGRVGEGNLSKADMLGMALETTEQVGRVIGNRDLTQYSQHGQQVVGSVR